MNITSVDQMVAEYLVYRGFTQSFRSFDAEKSKDRTKQFEVARIVDAIFNYFQSFEIEQFINLWDFLSKRFFFHLDGEHLSYSVMLKSELLKFYLVNAIKVNRREKVTDFFSMYSHEILSESGDHVSGNLRSWFVLPYMDEPERDNEFTVYFSQRWSESLRTTIGNFLSIVLSTAPAPKLLLLERWFHSEAQQEMRSQLSTSSKKVEALVMRLEKNEERLALLRTTLKDLVLHMQKNNVSGGGSSSTRPTHASGLFESDEEADFKRTKAKDLGQAVCKSAVECVHKASHLATMSKEAKMRDMLGEAAPLFFPKQPSSSSTLTSSEDTGAGKGANSVADLESQMLIAINQWMKHLSL